MVRPGRDIGKVEGETERDKEESERVTKGETGRYKARNRRRQFRDKGRNRGRKKRRNRRRDRIEGGDRELAEVGAEDKWVSAGVHFLLRNHLAAVCHTTFICSSSRPSQKSHLPAVEKGNTGQWLLPNTSPPA
jgi:hypothetical protein